MPSESSERPKPPPRAPKKRRGRIGRVRLLGIVALAVGLPATLYLWMLSREISKTFEGRLWTTPARVYSAPLTLEIGGTIPASQIEQRLQHSHYSKIGSSPRAPGQYCLRDGVLEVQTREFPMPGHPWPSRQLKVSLRRGLITSIVSLPSGSRLRKAQIEPESLASFFGANREERTVLPLSAFPKSLIDALLAAEDQRFFSHHGIDPVGVLRALFENVRSGSVVQGGSTITQQTVKNLYLTNERSLARKFKEALMAMILDARYPKERILEVYLNEIYLGQRGSVGVCGFGEASRFYFGKEVGDLDLAESAMLAGLVRAPAVYSPFTHPDRALARKNLVVQQMLDQGRVKPDEARRAKERVPLLAKGSLSSRRAPYFIEEVRQNLSQRHPEADLTENGLRIITTLDPWVQEKAEEALRRGLERLEKERPRLAKHRGGPLEGCLVVLRPRTGEVVALVGGRNYGESQFDRATQAKRQPGSLFKPIVFATGFEKGMLEGDTFTPATILEDEPLTLTVAGREWSPRNYEEDYRGNVTAREALEDSINIPTVRAAMSIGLERIAETAEAAHMGHDLKPYPSMALGAQEVTPLDAAAAFAMFANDGKRPEPYTIGAVVSAEGKMLEWSEPKLVPVLSPQAAYLTLDLMRGVVSRGTAWALRAHGITGDFAGKTGTTNDKRDAWFIGLRPDLLALVWVGFDDMTETSLAGAQGAVPIWEDFIRSIGQDHSDATFDRPEGVVWATIDPTTGGLATENCPETAEEVFIEGSLPAECPDHLENGFRRFWRHLFHRERPEPVRSEPSERIFE